MPNKGGAPGGAPPEGDSAKAEASRGKPSTEWRKGRKRAATQAAELARRGRLDVGGFHWTAHLAFLGWQLQLREPLEQATLSRAGPKEADLVL